MPGLFGLWGVTVFFFASFFSPFSFCAAETHNLINFLFWAWEKEKKAITKGENMIEWRIELQLTQKKMD